jgi:hypothetical protein
VGVIGVALFRKKSERIAPIAPRPFRDDARSSAGAAAEAAQPEAQLGTGHGRREASYAQYVDFERATSSPAEVVTLYYDSYANLVARGIVRETAPLAPLPRPFPGFVADPA